MQTRVEEGGPLGEHKGINLPGVAVSSPALTEKDRADMAFGLRELHVDYVALSFVRTAEDVGAAPRHDAAALGFAAPIVVKLEKGEAIDNLDAIMQRGRRGDGGARATSAWSWRLRRCRCCRSGSFSRRTSAASR